MPQRILLSTEPYRVPRARRRGARARATASPCTLVDGEWTSWYGSRAIAGLRALAALRTALVASSARVMKTAAPRARPLDAQARSYSGTRMPTVTAQ